MWKKYNPNPRGLNTGDCVIRALSKALGESWENIFVSLTNEALALCDMPSSNRVWSRYLTKRGFKRKLISDGCIDCFTVKRFCKEKPHGTYILALDGHVVCVKDGDVYDTWDSSNETPIYYFER